KQSDGLHYHGRDVAVMRAKLSGCPLILGSATPSMESFFNAKRGRYRLLELPDRVEARPLPPVRLLDLRAAGRHRLQPFRAHLAAGLTANHTAGGQSLLFLNRRGFANFLQCRACGDPVMCPNCSVTLTFHHRWRALRCHYCDYPAPPPPHCAACGDAAREARSPPTPAAAPSAVSPAPPRGRRRGTVPPVASRRSKRGASAPNSSRR